MTGVTWSLTNTAFGTPIETGTVAGGTNIPVATAFGYYSVLEESISIPFVTLATGTYWFQLSNGQDAFDNKCFWWDGERWSLITAFDADYGQIPSETFQIHRYLPRSHPASCCWAPACLRWPAWQPAGSF